MRRRAVVKWFDPGRGYGFLALAPEDGGRDLFVHHTSIDTPGFRTLAEGQVVEYEVGEDRKGRAVAVIVRPVEG